MTSGLLDELPVGAAGKKDRLWLEALRSDAVKKMRACSLGRQALLELQMDVFSYHARQAEARTV